MAKRNTGLNRAVTPDDILADVIGTSRPLPRTEITKRLWKYIKSNRLQDPDDRRVIVADSLLRELFNGKRSANMLDLPRFVSAHVTD